MNKFIILLARLTVLDVSADGVTVEEAVIAVEDAWIQAELSRDEATLRRVIDEQFVGNSNSGDTYDREALIATVLGGNMAGQTISERTVLVNGDTAVIYGTTEFRFASPGEEDTFALRRYTTVFVKRDEQWRAIALHMAKHADE